MKIDYFFSSARINLLLWIVILLYLVIYAAFTHHSPVSAYYYQAGRDWLSSHNLYVGNGWGFIYFPQSSLLYVPYALLPFKISEVLWRITLVVLLATSLWQLVKISPYPKKSFCILLTLSSYIVAMGSLKLGQMNIPIAALMLFTIVTIYQQKWWLSAIILIFALALKPTAIIFVGLIFCLYKPLRFKLFVVFILMMLLPFLFQNHVYILDQYKNCYHNFQTMIRNTTSNNTWAQMFSLIYMVTKIKFSKITLYLIRIIIGILVLLSGCFYKKYYSAKFSILLIYTLSAIYLMLFNPRTENNDYIILMPVMLWFCFYYWYKIKSKWLTISTSIYLILMTFNFGLSHTLHIPDIIIRPLTTVLFTLQLLYNIHISNLFIQECTR